MRSELQPALHLAEKVSLEEVAAFLGELEQIRVTALARLSSPAAASEPDELLDVGATAKRLGVSQDYLYRHQRKFPFARRIGRKLLFSSSGLSKFLARK
jgi:predicted DNA-binding transcriptional regulator AlpA